MAYRSGLSYAFTVVEAVAACSRSFCLLQNLFDLPSPSQNRVRITFNYTRPVQNEVGRKIFIQRGAASVLYWRLRKTTLQNPSNARFRSLRELLIVWSYVHRFKIFLNDSLPFRSNRH